MSGHFSNLPNEAWHNKEFLGCGEFTLEFGNYEVNITVPADHILPATGQLQGPQQVLNDSQRSRLGKAKTANRPVFIVTPEEALEKEKTASDPPQKKPGDVKPTMCATSPGPRRKNSYGMPKAINRGARLCR